MAREAHRELIQRAILYQVQIRMLCLSAARTRDLDSSSSESSSDSSSSSSTVSDGQDMVQHLLTTLLDTFRILHHITTTRYLQPRHHIIKIGQLELLTAFSQSETDLNQFLRIVRISPFVFNSIVDMIEHDPVFQNNSQNEQTPVDVQLAVTLYRMGRYGNGASLEDVAQFAGIGKGTVVDFTRRCFTAIEHLHPLFVRALTPDEKEHEKKWIDRHLGFRGLWRNGYLMYDGTIVPLAEKPAQNGHAYYTRKANYGLNAQVSGYFLVHFCTFNYVRSEMSLQTCGLWITAMAILVPHTIHRPLNIHPPTDIRHYSFLDMNLLG